MTTDTHDTAAALEAAIDAIACRRCDHDDPIGSTDRSALHRAITAHVEAEVARRLAPNLELWRWKCHDETIEQAIERLVRERNEYAEKLCERNAALVMAPDVEAAIAQIVACTDLMDNAGSARAREALRAAIAADKARSVDLDAIALAADLIGRHLAPTSDVARGAVARLEAMPARPTPDEARRLLDEYDRATRHSYVTGGPEHLRAARAALLRALGGRGVTARVDGPYCAIHDAAHPPCDPLDAGVISEIDRPVVLSPADADRVAALIEERPAPTKAMRALFAERR